MSAPSTLTDRGDLPAVPRFHGRQPRARVVAGARIHARAPIAPSGRSSTKAWRRCAERGFRFSMDHVTDLRMEPSELADRGFRFVKVPAKLLLNQRRRRADRHPSRRSRRPAGALRHRPDRRADRKREQVVDLLEYDVRFGQGFLFSPPRPVRAEALAGATARRGRERRAGERWLAAGASPAGASGRIDAAA